jgi:hypothetical protein
MVNWSTLLSFSLQLGVVLIALARRLVAYADPVDGVVPL